MGLLIVSQRPAKVDKNVLSQCNTQVVLKVTNPNDLKAIIQSVEGISGDLQDEIQRLPVGVALVAGGGLTQPVFVDIRPRLTRHGGRSVSVLHQEVEEDEPEPLPVAPLPAPASTSAGTLRPAASPAPASPRAAPLVPTAVPHEEPNGPAAGDDLLGDEDAFTDDVPGLEAFTASAQPPVQPTRAKPGAAPLPAAPAKAGKPRSAWDDALLEDELPTFRKPATGSPLAEADAPVRPAVRKSPAPLPDWDLAPIPAAPTPSVAPPPPRKSWPLTDAREIQRVGVRVGAVPAGQDPQRSLDVLWELAREHHKDPDAQLRVYREVAASACHEVPACIRCPLAQHCAYNARLRQERHKSRNLLSRLWRS